jgi:hypothetical protein
LAIAEGRTPAALAHTLHRDRAAITSHFDDPLGNDFAVEGVTKLALVRIRNAVVRHSKIGRRCPLWVIRDRGY